MRIFLTLTIVFCAGFLPAMSRAQGAAGSEVEALVGACLGQTRTPCETRAASYVMQSKINETARLTEIVNAAYTDVCAGLMPPAQALEVLRASSLPVNVREAARAFDQQARRCPNAKQVAINALEWLPSVSQRNLLLSLLLREQGSCDAACQRRSATLFDPNDARNADEMLIYARRIIETARPSDPLFLETLAQLEKMARLAPRTQQTGLQLALIPFYAQTGQREPLLDLLNRLPRKILNDGPYAQGLRATVSGFEKLTSDLKWDQALSILDALPPSQPQRIQRARVLAEITACRDDCARAAIAGIEAVAGEDADATQALLALVLKFEQVPKVLFDLGLEASGRQLLALDRDLRRVAMITSVEVNETPRILELRAQKGSISAKRARLELRNPTGCGSGCYQSAIAALRALVGQDYGATIALSEIVLEDYQGRLSEQALVRSGLSRLSALALTQAQRGRVAVLKARLEIENPAGCSQTCRSQALAGVRPFVGVDISATLAFASIVLGDFVGFEGEAATARQGLNALNPNLLTQKEQGQAASAFAELLIKDPSGCNSACEARAFQSLSPLVGRDAEATLSYGTIILSNIVDYQDQIDRAVEGLERLEPSLLTRKNQSRAAVTIAKLLLRHPQGCGSSCQRRAFGAIEGWIGQDLGASLAFGELVLEDYVARESLAERAIDGLQALDVRRLEPSEQGRAAIMTARLRVQAPNGCSQQCRRDAETRVRPFLGQDLQTTQNFAELVLSNYQALEALSAEAQRGLKALENRQIPTAKRATLATLDFRLAVENPEGCNSSCAQSAENTLAPFLGQALAPTLVFADAVLSEGSVFRSRREKALSVLEGLNRDRLQRSEQGEVALKIADLLLEDPQGCPQTCENKAFRGLRPYLGVDRATTLGFADRVLNSVRGAPSLYSDAALPLTNGTRPLDLVLQPSSRTIDKLSALNPEDLQLWHREAVSALRSLREDTLTFEQRALRAAVLAELNLRAPAQCQATCRSDSLTLWNGYLGRDPAASLRFASLVASDLNRLNKRRYALLDELEVLNWAWDQPDRVSADVRDLLADVIDPLLPQAQDYYTQALKALANIPLSRLTFEQEGALAASRFTLRVAQPGACDLACLDQTFAATKRFLGIDVGTTLRVAQTAYGDPRTKSRYSDTLSSALNRLVEGPRALKLQEGERLIIASLRLTSGETCAFACRRAAIGLLEPVLGDHLPSALQYGRWVLTHLPLEKGATAIRALDQLADDPLSIDDRIEVTSLANALKDAQACNRSCAEASLKRWAQLAKNAEEAALEYARQIDGRLDLDQNHAQSALAALRAMDAQSPTLSLGARAERLRRIKSLSVQVGIQPPENRLLAISGLLNAKAPIPAAQPVKGLVKSSIPACALQTFEAAITPPAQFKDDMPRFEVLPASCKIAALQALLTALGFPTQPDGLFGPASRRQVSAAFKDAGIEKKLKDDFEDWMLIELMRARTQAIRPAMALLQGG